ncbi:PAS domain-containing protein [Stigmatella sp. ncwal1]|uniref:histidine kinase n=1 Tax=Stigmatella ashevillensis TaxID=2995309 RepID=A0ABT5D8P9_9BACT|nr:PAS domain-containing protein [Stigmatella ashevillena]MDC0710039.1 PAS domain-containing protein [Stigmatella ashevillena]
MTALDGSGSLFFSGGGQTGALMGALDWSRTRLGPLSGWPQRLTAVVETLLHSPVAMVLLWGPDHVMLYNDGYAALCADQHPGALGMPVAECWPEHWDFYRELTEAVFRGEKRTVHGQPLRGPRNGGSEEACFDLSFSPVRDDQGRISGALCIAIETGGQGAALKRQQATEAALREANERLQLALNAGAVMGTWVWNVPEDRFTADERFARTFSIDSNVAAQGVPLRTILESIHPEDRAQIQLLIGRTLETGGPYRAEYRVVQFDGSYRWLEANGRCELGEDGKPLRFPGVLLNIDKRKRAELRQSALVELGDGLKESRDKKDITATAEGILGRTLAVLSTGLRRDPVDLYREETWWPEEASFIRDVADRTWAAVERADAEKRLRESEGKLRSAAEFDPRIPWTADPRGRVTSCGARLMEFSGLQEVEVLDDAWKRFPHPEDREAMVAAWARSVETGASYEVEVRIRTPAKGLRWTRLRALPQRDAEGRILQWYGTMEDMHERRSAEEALRQLNETLEQRVEERTRARDLVWRVSQDLLVLCGLDGRYRSVNPAWREALGHGEAALIGERFEQLIHPEEVPSMTRELGRLREGQVIRDFDLRMRAQDGTYRWYSWTCVPEGDGFYGAGRDMTARRALEDQLRQAQKMEAVGQLTGGIAHDFNNLLTGIIGSLSLLQRRLTLGQTDQLGRYISVATNSAQRAAALTHRLLAFSRRQSLDLKPVDMNQLVASMEDLLHRTMGESITIKADLRAGVWPAFTDANQLENAFLNLCINARDAMAEGGTLTVETSNTHLDEDYVRQYEALKPGDYVVLSVSDTGTGIPPEVMDKVFDPFFTTKPVGQGTGLGLSMIYGFVKQSEGHVRLDSEVGKGTAVKLFLPRYRGGREEVDGSGRLQAPRGEGEKVLVVEDDAAVRMLVVEVLGELGYTALEAVDAQTAIPLLESDRQLDLMISDVGLPGMNGRQLATIARQHRPVLKVLFITGYAEKAAIRGDFLEPGMEMIAKPFDIDMLAARIRDMLIRQ